eukprot:TRINITY_DN11015_c0_g1_i1.p1 TRINITY_DN11015_c0_g1~~TRINITY_DN11015_c0_g1_i1.p1  ORF type:complete len:562 (+),score=105.24 TRINITY_DN11015_c0_g1_i1:66-1688(+)
MSGLLRWVREHPYLSLSLAGGGVVLAGGYTFISRAAEADKKRREEQKRLTDALSAAPNANSSAPVASPFSSNSPVSPFSSLFAPPGSSSPSSPLTMSPPPPLVPASRPVSAPASPPISELVEATALNVGHSLPPFELEAVLGDEDVDLSQNSYAGRWLVFVFYPQNWSCTKELLDFEAHLGDYEKGNATLIGVSTHSNLSNESWNTRDRSNGGGGNIGFPLIGDDDMILGKKLGVPVIEGKYAPVWFLVDPSRVICSRGLGLKADEPLASLEFLSVRHTREAFASAKEEIIKLLKEKNCGPLLIRLAWHDAGTFSAAAGDGGSNASLQFAPELNHGCNRGLHIAIELLAPLKKLFPQISTADFWQFAAVIAIKQMGGPHIPFSFGRRDSTGSSDCTSDGRLPDGAKGADHLREVFHRMGMNDRDIVALSGAHTVGRTHPERSGFEGAWTDSSQTFDNVYFKDLLEKKWTERSTQPLQYEDESKSVMMLPSDLALLSDSKFNQHVQRYARSQETWFRDFTASFRKLQNQGHHVGALKLLSL